VTAFGDMSVLGYLVEAATMLVLIAWFGTFLVAVPLWLVWRWRTRAERRIVQGYVNRALREGRSGKVT
jgi:hypothetical protein